MTSRPLRIGALAFPGIDQIDLTGPFEVLSRLPDSRFDIVWKERTPVRDVNGLILTPTASFAEAPVLDILVVPGGFGQQPLMDDDEVLSFVRARAAGARFVFSVCTGALVCGAAGLLRGVRSTTHWSTFHLLPYFGAVPVDRRVVVDGRHVSASGVTAGLDGALTLAALVAGEAAAQQIQLGIEYAPEPPFDSGTPRTATPEVRRAVMERIRGLSEERLATAVRVGRRLGIDVDRIAGVAGIAGGALGE